MKHNQMRQVVFPILAAFIWGTAFVAQDMCADAIGAFTFNAARYFIAVLALLVVILISDKMKKDKPVLSAEETLPADRVIVCCGGMAGGKLGGTRSGKSALAEALVTAKARGPVWYLATARPLGDDPAMAERIRRHRSRRPAHWHTLECPRHPGRELAPLLAAQAADAPVPTILLDCVTLWMSNILFALDDPQDAAAFETSLTEEVDELLHVMRAFPCRWVLVSGETGLGGIRAERLARVFDDGLGLANQMLAAQAREAFLVVAGRCLRLEKLEF